MHLVSCLRTSDLRYGPSNCPYGGVNGLERKICGDQETHDRYGLAGGPVEHRAHTELQQDAVDILGSPSGNVGARLHGKLGHAAQPAVPQPIAEPCHEIGEAPSTSFSLRRVHLQRPVRGVQVSEGRRAGVRPGLAPRLEFSDSASAASDECKWNTEALGHRADHDEIGTTDSIRAQWAAPSDAVRAARAGGSAENSESLGVVEHQAPIMAPGDAQVLDQWCGLSAARAPAIRYNDWTAISMHVVVEKIGQPFRVVMREGSAGYAPAGEAFDAPPSYRVGASIEVDGSARRNQDLQVPECVQRRPRHGRTFGARQPGQAFGNPVGHGGLVQGGRNTKGELSPRPQGRGRMP